MPNLHLNVSDLEIIYKITVILIETIVSILYFGVDRVAFFTKTSVGASFFVILKGDMMDQFQHIFVGAFVVRFMAM